MHDSQALDDLLLGDETALYVDAAYYSQKTRDTLKQRGIEDQVQRKGYRNKPLSKALYAVMPALRPHFPLEKGFCHVQMALWISANALYAPRQNTTFYGLATMAANICKGAKFLAKYGLLERCYAG